MIQRCIFHLKKKKFKSIRLELIFMLVKFFTRKIRENIKRREDYTLCHYIKNEKPLLKETNINIVQRIRRFKASKTVISVHEIEGKSTLKT